jgi:hypothetical protein
MYAGTPVAVRRGHNRGSVIPGQFFLSSRRYLRVPFADEDGWTATDFNRAIPAPPHDSLLMPPTDHS